MLFVQYRFTIGGRVLRKPVMVFEVYLVASFTLQRQVSVCAFAEELSFVSILPRLVLSKQVSMISVPEAFVAVSFKLLSHVSQLQ